MSKHGENRRTSRAAVLSDEFRDDLHCWIETDRKTALRLIGLMEAALREPFSGIGKPEHLKQLRGNIWSRRINEVDRLVYEVFGDRIVFHQARYHYG